ncbi:exonuclease domain-containing protein [Marinoscillum sp.]|uniref:exonuclease domain-containing protein n=1 Tax=Marinoscillum sp. TaxID=2024838 RepID=UPI003BAB05B6
MKYLALDVETANSDYSSLCQIGIVEFENGKVIRKWSSLINPESYFDPFNTSIHDISEENIIDSPTFPTLYEQLSDFLTQKFVVHHMPFDRIALSRVCKKYDLPDISAKWIDSAKVSRRTWEKFARSGYSLFNVSLSLGIRFQHHDALEDSIAAGLIFHEACNIKNLSVEEWYERLGHTGKSSNSKKAIKLEGNADGELYGETLVFTGTLSLVRDEAARMAAELGCNVTNSVTKKTTMLVVGFQEKDRLAGYEKSSKHRKAEELIKKGSPIKILSEEDFKTIIDLE